MEDFTSGVKETWFENDEFIVKPLVAGAITTLGQYYFIDARKSWAANAWIGAAVGGGVLLGQTVYNQFVLKHDKEKTTSDVVLESALAAAAGVGVNALVGDTRFMGTQTAVILASVIGANLASDYLGVQSE